MSEHDADLVICRCEEVTVREIMEAIEMGAHSMWQVRRMTRAGMGLCQGSSCQQLVARLLANSLQLPIEKVMTPSYRPPVRPVPLDTLCSGERVELE
jgi:NAD(P)H-nitrite reductase large subunit